ncbi:hypothetical protein B296_00002506 [Ensete ventricosum]|uniref:Uncharacterized protein n=1 Tax=Ensete ventricosum TaxID=4639 RepID=A0A427AUM5_ENSVE|nr:hypothetical protein B296_00002506 [Ensete ventricosum]
MGYKRGNNSGYKQGKVGEVATSMVEMTEAAIEEEMAAFGGSGKGRLEAIVVGEKGEEAESKGWKQLWQ